MVVIWSILALKTLPYGNVIALRFLKTVSNSARRTETFPCLDARPQPILLPKRVAVALRGRES